MNTSIVKKSFLTSDEYIELHSDSKQMYMYFLICPDKGYLDVFKFNKHLAMLCTGLSTHSIDAGIKELVAAGFVEVFNGYIALLKGHNAGVGGAYGASNREKELSSLPLDVREHFGLDSDVSLTEIKTRPVKKKPGPEPETIKTILAKQPEELRTALLDFIEDRKERNKSPTTRAVKGWINKLHKLYPDKIDKQIASLQQSIERGWMGLFPIKEDASNSEDRVFM